MRVFIAIVLVICLGLVSLFFTNQPQIPPKQERPEVVAIEAALSDGQLLAIANIDVGYIREITEAVYGKLNVSMFPVLSENGLMGQLLSVDKDMAEVSNISVGIKRSSDEAPASILLVFTGVFGVDQIYNQLNLNYEVDKDDSQWVTITEKVVPDEDGCLDEQKLRNVKKEYLFVSDTLILLSEDMSQGQVFLERYRKKAPETQSLEAWREYRKGAVAAFNLGNPFQASAAIPGMTGYILKSETKKNPEITGVSAKVAVDIRSISLSLNARLDSDNHNWIATTIEKSNLKLENAKDDVELVSPTFRDLVTTVTVNTDRKGVVYDAEIGIEMLERLNDILSEAFSYAMGGNNKQRKPEAERIENNPVDYALNKHFEKLPDAKDSPFLESPLLKNGPFIIDVDYLKKNENGQFEMRVLGKVSLPNIETKDGSKPSGRMKLHVKSVLDKNGKELLKNERCDSNKSHFGDRNHKATVSEYYSGDDISSWKTVRLEEGAIPSEVDRLIGEISFNSPIKVHKFKVPLKVGSEIDHLGMRFYLSKVGSQQVGYQLSGNTSRLLEVRALNADGKVLSKSWRFGDADGSKVVQGYKGDVKSLELYLVEQTKELKLPFEVNHIFSHQTVKPEENLSISSSNVNYPKAITVDDLDAYNSIDSVQPDGRSWDGGRDHPLIGEAIWPGASSFFTHKYDQAWDNYPKAHVYLPGLPGLAGNWSAFSYSFEEPKEDNNFVIQYHSIFYSYYTKTGEVNFPKYQIFDGKPFYVANIHFDHQTTEKLQRVKGIYYLRIPHKIESTKLNIDALWEEKEVDGVKIKMTGLSRGMFPGYNLKVTGNVGRLVGIFGSVSDEKLFKPHTENYQDDDSWTVTIPFIEGLENIKVLTASQQKVINFPFDIEPTYVQ